ncbi:hypothetical protein BD410DRAFT_789437, partial [Rickenella mellea]
MMKGQVSSSELRPREWIRFLCVRRSSAQIVTEILRLCCNLKGFSWNHYYTDIKPPDWEAAQDEMIRHIPTNLRFLNWNGAIQFNTLAEFLRKTSASLQILCACRIQVNKLPQQPLLRASYPSLTHVHLEGTSLFVWLEAVNWEMPSLIELNLFELYVGQGFPKVFRTVGKTLRVLRLGRYVRLMPELLSHILDAYANLEELYYHTGYGGVDDTPRWAFDVTHMKMQKVGIDASMAKSMDFSEASPMLRDRFGPISKTRFPLLDTLIIYDISIGSLVLTNHTFVMRRVAEDFYSAEISWMTAYFK